MYYAVTKYNTMRDGNRNQMKGEQQKILPMDKQNKTNQASLLNVGLQI